jgi:thymidylate kinase
MRLNHIIKFKKFYNKNINFITIDGIACSGKTFLSNFLKKNFKNSLIISKDLFLIPRNKRIQITKLLKKKNYNQNNIHYDLNKLKSLFYFLLDGRKKKIVLKKLYNRKSGKNNLTKSFYYKKNRNIIYEGIYTNNDIKKITKPTLKILLIANVYTSIFRKIERIRDRKISIQNLVNEFLKIHLTSFIKYLKQNHFNLVYADFSKNFTIMKNGKLKQINDIKKFLHKHQN